MSQKDKVLEILKSVSPLPKQGRENITADKKGNNKGIVLGKVRNFGASREQQSGSICAFDVNNNQDAILFLM